MKILVDISEQDYVYIAKKHCLPSCDDMTLRKIFYEMILNGIPLDKIESEIRNEQNMDYKCHRKTYNNCLRIIDKYKVESGV